MRQYKRPTEQNRDPYQAQPLPVEKPVAVYYRQSSEAQIGNISTTLQTVDMVEHPVRLGWTPERVIMIDMDAGISGTKKINERPGMSQLYQMIEHRQIGAVAAQDVDRFFRDVTQIESNIFMDACRRNNVLVLTPTMVFDFDHPTQGRYHMQMFRDQAQRAADYLEYHVRGRLVKSRHWRSERGMWAGRKIAPGYMVDMREKLPDGSRNPNHRKYIPCEPYAEVIHTYFKLFQEYDGSYEHAWQHIQANGPFYPELTDDLIPEGFLFRQHFNWRSPTTGRLCPSRGGLRFLLVNVVYIGHWIHKEVIVQWHNHEAIVPPDLFLYAYNRLSPTDFHGEVNPDYQPYRPFKRSPKSERNVPYPTYSGLVFSDDIPELSHRRLATSWNSWSQQYQYMLYFPSEHAHLWNIKTHIVDPAVDQLLLERLKATTLDETSWQEAMQDEKQGGHNDVVRIEQEIRRLKQEQTNVIASLGKLTNDEMILRAQAQYEAAAHRIEELTCELDELKSAARRQKVITQARPALERIIEHWERVPAHEKRVLFEAFARHINITRLSRTDKQLTIYWRDDSTSSEIVSRYSIGHYWDDYELAELKQLIEITADQVTILRAFPGYTWRMLIEKYAYHFGGNGKRYNGLYKGELKYPRKTRWEDTDEYKAEEAQTVGVSASTVRYVFTFCVTAA
ncbi:MAG: recombinase family protein [Anaerolineae bacterium]|nr:recombinase family protein [Anaerolineae bacterium]